MTFHTLPAVVTGEATEPLRCVECGRVQVADEHGWPAYPTTDEHEPVEAVVLCPDCAAREFDAPPNPPPKM